jgi:hypothetical protein
VDVFQLIPSPATIRPWVDPVVDARGHDPRGAYVERYWLGVIGPTATWIVRRLADRFDDRPDGFTLDLAHTATAMGLSFAKGANSPFGKALHRCVMFGLAQPLSDGFAVRRRLPDVARRHLGRLPDDLQAEHDTWIRRRVDIDRREVEDHLVGAGLPRQLAVRLSESAALAA